MLFEAGIKIGNQNLTDEGRGLIAKERETREVMVELASGRRVRYTKKIAQIFNVTWTNIPSATNSTIDNNAARDWMNDNLRNTNDVLELTFRSESDDDEEYDVFVTAYSEELVRRGADEFLWNVTISFEEE